MFSREICQISISMIIQAKYHKWDILMKKNDKIKYKQKKYRKNIQVSTV